MCSWLRLHVFTWWHDYARALGGGVSFECYNLQPALIQSRIKMRRHCLFSCCARLYVGSDQSRAHKLWPKEGQTKKIWHVDVELLTKTRGEGRATIIWGARDGGKSFMMRATKILSEAFSLFRRRRRSNIFIGILGSQLFRKTGTPSDYPALVDTFGKFI